MTPDIEEWSRREMDAFDRLSPELQKEINTYPVGVSAQVIELQVTEYGEAMILKLFRDKARFKTA